MRVSTGVVDDDLTDDQIKDILIERCTSRGLTPDWDTWKIQVVRDMKISTVESETNE